MKNIRIGNDICLHVHLFGDNVESYTNIESIDAYFVNVDGRTSSEYIRRFPMEPLSDRYHATLYDICSSGDPIYNVKPAYTGFGVYPHSFSAFYKKAQHLNPYIFKAPAEVKSDEITIYFPASNQLHVGKYTLIIVVRLHQPGYSPNSDLRTITVDYSKILNLVGSSGQTSPDGGQSELTDPSDPSIDVYTTDMHLTSVGTISTGSGNNTRNFLTFNVSGMEEPLTIDTTKYTVWYEGN